MNRDPGGLSRRETAALGLGLALLAAGRAQGAQPLAPPPTPPGATAQSRQLGAAAAAFGLGMLRQLMTDAPRATLVTSPLSLAADMLMLGQGARGATAALLTQGLKLPQGLSLADAAKGFANLAARLVSSDAATVAIADGLWADTHAGLVPAYRKTLQSLFAARASVGDLASPAALADINRFVSDTTHGKIPTILGRMPVAAMIVLVNALYFKGGWKTPFDAGQTQAAPFTHADGATAPTPLMHQRGHYAYRETDRLQALALPYADSRFELRLVLAKPGAPPDAWMGGFSGYDGAREGEVFLPRLDLTWGGDLTGVLGQIGLGPALASSANYSGALTAPLAGLAVVQKCLLKVDEQGAEAAAASAVIMVGAAMVRTPPPPPFVFRADRPFHLMLVETATGAPLILAYVAAPATSGG
jgi:serine protease inhibitor